MTFQPQFDLSGALEVYEEPRTAVMDGFPSEKESKIRRAVVFHGLGSGTGRVTFMMTGFPFGVRTKLVRDSSKSSQNFSNNNAFSAYAENRGLMVRYSTIDDNGTLVNLPEFGAVASEYTITPTGVALGLTESQYNSLKGLSTSGGEKDSLILDKTLNETSDQNDEKFYSCKVGLFDEATDTEIYPSAGNEIYVYSIDQLLFLTLDYASQDSLPTTYVRNYEEGIGEFEYFSFEENISLIDGNTDEISVPDAEDKLTTGLSHGDTFAVEANRHFAGIYTVKSVSHASGISVIKVEEDIPTATGNYGRFRIFKTMEDYFIGKDQAGTLASYKGGGATVDELHKIVSDFDNALSIIMDDANSETAIEGIVNSYAGNLFDRAVTVVQYGGFDTDDRPLYWARNKMLVLLKSHPVVLKDLVLRNRMVKAFEVGSRGYSGVSFAGMPAGAKRILISGFDPFLLNSEDSENIYNSNPAGVNALALHGKTLLDTDNTTVLGYVQAMIFPVRYKDFNDSVIETAFMDWIKKDGAGLDKVDMIWTQSLGRPFRFDVDRFPCRNRGGKPDNNYVSNEELSFRQIHDADEPGAEFYETRLPVAKIVPATNVITDPFFVYYDQTYSYFRKTLGRNSEDNAKLKKYDNRCTEGFQPISDDPESKDSTNLLPISETTAQIEGKLGSGSNYLSNEIFYRVARLRAIHNETLPTGHLHLPDLQEWEPVSYNCRKVAGSTKPVGTQDFDDANTRLMTQKTIELMKSALK